MKISKLLLSTLALISIFTINVNSASYKNNTVIAEESENNRPVCYMGSPAYGDDFFMPYDYEEYGIYFKQKGNYWILNFRSSNAHYYSIEFNNIKFGYDEIAYSNLDFSYIKNVELEDWNPFEPTYSGKTSYNISILLYPDGSPVNNDKHLEVYISSDDNKEDAYTAFKKSKINQVNPIASLAFSYSTAIDEEGNEKYSFTTNSKDGVGLRMGMHVPYTYLDEMTSFGIEYKTGSDSVFKESKHDVSSVDMDTYYVTIENQKTLEYYVRFVVPMDKLDLTIYARAYVLINGEKYYTQERSTTVKELAYDYLTNHSSNEAVIAAQSALEELAK